MNELVKVAGVQMAPVIGDTRYNLDLCLERLEAAAKEGARLVVFPEAAISGYIFNSLEEALPFAETVPGPSTAALEQRCRELEVFAAFGLLERDGDDCYNTAVLLGPAGLVGTYRKLHLPYVGVDRFVTPGDRAPLVYDTELGRIGLAICYDQEFPELSRVLALQGAEVIVTMTNWLEGIEYIPEYVLRTRAKENQVFQLAVNRVGTERGCTFFGRSTFIDCFGTRLADAKDHAEDMIWAEIDPALARDKRKVVVPGVGEVDLFRDRRPEFYSPLADIRP